MYTILVCVAIGVISLSIFAWHLGVKAEGGKPTKVVLLFGGFLFGVLFGGGCGYVAAREIGIHSPQHQEVTEHAMLASSKESTWVKVENVGFDKVNLTYSIQTPNGIRQVKQEVLSKNIYIKLDASADSGYVDTLDWVFDRQQDGTWGVPLGDEILVFHLPSDATLPTV